MRTSQVGAVVQALFAIANSDDTFWQAAFTVSAALCVLVALHEDRRDASDPARRP